MKRTGIVCALIAVAAASCGDSEPGDASARLACDHFRNVAADYSDGVLTKAELRDEMGEVYDDAQLSEVAGLAEAGRAMMAELTAGQMGDRFDEAVTDFGDACRSIDR